MNRFYRSRLNPFCKSTNTGPPVVVTLLLSVFVVAGGIGGGTRYFTRAKPKLDQKPVAAPAVVSSRPNTKDPAFLPTMDISSQSVPKAITPPLLTRDEPPNVSQVDESLKQTAGSIGRHSSRASSWDDLRSRAVNAVKWSSLSRTAQEEVLQIIHMIETKSRELTKQERDLLVDLTGDFCHKDRR